jgi:peptidyl-prolyl cis-trans isomerase SurA
MHEPRFRRGRGVCRAVPLLVALALATVCPAQTSRVDGVAAYVNQNTITIGDVLVSIEPVRRQLAANLSGAELRKALAKSYTEGVQRLVDKRLVLDAYAKQENKVPAWAVDQRVEEIVNDMFQGDRASLMAELAKEQITYEQWRKDMQEHVVVSSMRQANVDQGVKLAPGAVRAHYDAHRSEYTQSGQVHLRMIVLTKPGVDAEDEARRRLAADLRDQARAGADFGALARTNSTSAKTREGGDWGWVDADKDLRKELADAVRALQPGQVSDPVETSGEIYVLKVDERREGAPASFEDVSSRIEKELRQRESERLYRAWIDRLAADSYVKVFATNPFAE